MQFKLSTTGVSSSKAHLLQATIEQRDFPHSHAGTRHVMLASLQAAQMSPAKSGIYTIFAMYIAFARSVTLQLLGQGILKLLELLNCSTYCILLTIIAQTLSPLYNNGMISCLSENADPALTRRHPGPLLQLLGQSSH